MVTLSEYTADYAHERVRPDARALAGWRVETLDGLPRTAHGRCPHCGHECEIEVRVDVPTSVPVAGRVDHPVLTRQMVCDCTRPHGGDGSLSGCGRWWLAEFVADDAGRYLLRPAGDESLLPAATALEETASRMNEGIRSAAERWMAGIAALYGLFGVVGVAVGGEAAADLGTAARAGTALAVVVGLGCAATATVLGYRAAYGWPGVTRVDSDEALRRWWASHLGYGRAAAAALRQAIVFGTAGWMALVVAAGVVWVGPGAQEPAAAVRVTWGDGSRVCGELIPAGPGVMSVRRADGTVDRRPVGAASRIEVVAGC